MKSIKLCITIFFFTIFTSCEDYFNDVNVDPDNPASVTPDALLPAIEVRLAYTLWGDFSRYIGIFSQHIDGFGRCYAMQNYTIQPYEVDRMWSNMYAGVLADCRQLAHMSIEKDANHYLAIAKAMEAYSVLLLTDYFGDIPYSEALQGTDILQPVFDDQADVYNAIFALIQEARQLLNGDNGPYSTIQGDFIYEGDVTKWRKFVNVLEARAHLHLADTDPARYQMALNALAKGGFESGDDDARLPFGTEPTEAAPWYQWMTQRGEMNVGDSYVQLMMDYKDPRVNTHGARIGPNITPHPIFLSDRAVPLLTYVEQKFIEAECLFQTGGDAYDPYMQAVSASLDEHAIAFGNLNKDRLVYIDSVQVLVESVNIYAANADYLASPHVAVGNTSLTLEHIMIQKYIALLCDPEVFCDWRRTGTPVLVPNTGTEIPRRLPYPQSELDANPQNTPSPADVNIFTPVDWDV